MLGLRPETKNIKLPTVLNVFCGAGGMSLGFQKAGCKILGGINKNPTDFTAPIP